MLILYCLLQPGVTKVYSVEASVRLGGRPTRVKNVQRVVSQTSVWPLAVVAHPLFPYRAHPGTRWPSRPGCSTSRRSATCRKSDPKMINDDRNVPVFVIHAARSTSDISEDETERDLWPLLVIDEDLVEVPGALVTDGVLHILQQALVHFH